MAALRSYEIVILEVLSDMAGGIRSLVTLFLELPATDLTLGREDTIAPTTQEEMEVGVGGFKKLCSLNSPSPSPLIITLNPSVHFH